MNRRKFFGAIGSGVIAAFMPKLFGRGTPGADPVAPDPALVSDYRAGFDLGEGDFTVEGHVRFDDGPWQHVCRVSCKDTDQYFVEGVQVTREEYDAAGGQVIDFPGLESGDYVDIRT